MRDSWLTRSTYEFLAICDLYTRSLYINYLTHEVFGQGLCSLGLWSSVFIFRFLDTLRFRVECWLQIYRLSFIYCLSAISWITWMRPADWDGIGWDVNFLFSYNTIFQGSIFPFVGWSQTDLMWTIKITSKVALWTSEVLLNYKIFSKILIRFIHLPCVLIASLIHLKLLK